MIIRSKVLKKKAICIITACLMLSVLSGCNKTEKANNDESAISAREESGDIEFDRGKVKDHTYTNSFYGISFDLPNEWHIYPMEELAKESDLSEAQYTDTMMMKLARSEKDPLVFMANNNDLDNPEMITIRLVYKIDGRYDNRSEEAKQTAYALVDKVAGSSYDSFEMKTIDINGTKYYQTDADYTYKGEKRYFSSVIYGDNDYNLSVSVMSYDDKRCEDLLKSIFDIKE